MTQAIRTWPDIIPAENRTLGDSAALWAMRNLRQPDGPDAGEPWRFTNEQMGILLRWYEIDANGRFVHRRGVLRRMKGWGKDPFLAAISAVEFVGPCRFGGWDENGSPIAIPAPAAWIQVAAVSKEQTRNTMTLFPGLFSKECVAEYGIDLGKEIIYAEGGARRIEAVTSSPRAIEGGRPTFVILNESHHWVLANEGRAMAEGIRRNLGKSRDGSARSMEITNAHLPDEGSVAEDTYEAERKANFKLEGVYYDSLEAPPVEDLSDVEAVKAALILARGDSVWLDVDRLAAEIADPTTLEGVSRRFYFNQVTRLGGTWLPAGAWDDCAEDGIKIKRSRRIVLALDGSYNGDSTALLASSIQKNAVVEVVGCWESPPEDPAWKVNIADVEQAVRNVCSRYDVEEIAADPFRWSRSLEALEAEGLPVVPFPQSPQRMTPATTRFYEAVVNKLLRHNGDQRLARHIANAVLKQDARGIRLAKESKNSPRKIDLAVAAVMAYDRAMTLLTEEQPDTCPTCGGPLDEYGRCETCPPQVFSLREMVEQMQRETAKQSTERKQMPAPPEQQPFTGSATPMPTFHKV